ncbi:MAG: nucleotidyl transferase AbiEii/AbiGii toxin family protein [Deltaproteobacteria bacterium]|nr:nucleotidyl transferase AbiEii/AbiGii toxin family protein [Deltaproteobacteria bacterium]
MSIRADIELFHLLFIKSFLTTQDKSLVVLKGGCNLRFFMGSNRYSEDIDFDVATIGREPLKKRVDKILSSHSLRNSLATRKIHIIAHSAPKQTDTVQRWKVMIHAHGLDIPTKIEFSRRGIDREGTVFESVDPMILAEYRLTPSFISHYKASYAVTQKIEALAGRPETQARDIFDLAHLFNRNPNLVVKAQKSLIEKAIDAAISVDFDQFRGQVVEFLTAEAQDYYGSGEVWETLLHQVVAKVQSISA